jgi:hypothetical protein
MGVEISARVFGIDDANLRPEPKGKLQCRVRFAAPRRPAQRQAKPRLPALGFADHWAS